MLEELASSQSRHSGKHGLAEEHGVKDHQIPPLKQGPVGHEVGCPASLKKRGYGLKFQT